MWDTAGQESFRSITRSYYRGASGALLVFDVTHRSSFAHLPQWLADLREFGDPELAVLVVGNKADLCAEEDAATAGGAAEAAERSGAVVVEDEEGRRGKREVPKEEAARWAEENGLQYLETSAKTGQNVEEVHLSALYCPSLPKLTALSHRRLRQSADNCTHQAHWMARLRTDRGTEAPASR